MSHLEVFFNLRSSFVSGSIGDFERNRAAAG
jgi:hypothetical protein